MVSVRCREVAGRPSVATFAKGGKGGKGGKSDAPAKEEKGGKGGAGGVDVQKISTEAKKDAVGGRRAVLHVWPERGLSAASCCQCLHREPRAWRELNRKQLATGTGCNGSVTAKRNTVARAC